MSVLELRGLKGLQNIDLDNLLHDTKTQQSVQSISYLSIDVLKSGKYQPRTGMNEEALSDLASSIKAQGIIQPLVVRKIDRDQYEIIAGERRWRAAKMAGLSTVPAIIRNVNDETALAFALIENIQRESLNAIDEAISLERLQNEFSMTHEEIAEKVGRSRSAVTNLMRLLMLHEDVKCLLQSRKIEMGHARALLTLERYEQVQVAKKIIRDNLSLRDTEKVVRKMKQEISDSSPVVDHYFEEKISDWVKYLSTEFSSKVNINLNSSGVGKLVIHVQSLDEIEMIINKIKNKY